MSLAHLLSQHWVLEDRIFDAMTTVILRHDAGVRLTADEITAAIGRAPETPHPRDRAYVVHQGVAIIPVQGVLAKHAGQVGGVSQPKGTAYESIAADLRTAVQDPEVRAIMIHVESPGGTVDGVQSAAAAITAAAAVKKTMAFIDGVGASGGFWLASAAPTILANETAIVGSIGVITSMDDTRAAHDKAGVKRHILRSVPYKAAGQAGETVTDAHLAAAQKVIDDLHTIFAAQVSASRDLTGEALAAAADGRVHVAGEALKLGLIDGISSFDQALADLAASVAPSSSMRRPAALSSSTTAGAGPAASGPQPMQIEPKRLAELIGQHSAHAPLIATMAADNATEPEILGAIQGKQVTDLTAQVASLTQASIAAKTAHDAAIAAKDTEIGAIKAEAAELREKLALAPKPGTQPLAGGNQSGDQVTAQAAYDAKLAELKAAGHKNASVVLAKTFPNIHSAYLASVQAQANARTGGAL